MELTMYLCSWCGGHAKEQGDSSSDYTEKPIEFLKLNIPPSFQNPKKPNTLTCCERCYYKIFHNLLGQPLYHGSELTHLQDSSMKKGYVPQRVSRVDVS